MKSTPVQQGFTQLAMTVTVDKNITRTSTTSPVTSLTGFTLIEVVIAMILLTAGLMTLLSVTLGGMLQREVTREYDIARNAAFAKVEEIRSQDFSDVSDYDGDYFGVDGLTAPTGWTNPGKIEVNDDVSDLFDITVTIRWQIQGNTSANVYNEYVTQTLITRKSKY